VVVGAVAQRLHLGAGRGFGLMAPAFSSWLEIGGLSCHHPRLRTSPHTHPAYRQQGVVAETLLLSNLPGYSVGGTVHVVTNNQVSGR
jgi:2-oxoglutarate decarboxylase